MEIKAQIRKAYKAKRQEMPETEVVTASEKICEVIASSGFYQTAERIGFYYPLGKEVRLNKLAERAWQDGKRTCFPRVDGGNMEFYEITDFSQLREGCFHVMEPMDTYDTASVPELILVPGVVFDLMGNRAGYGKGFYDRYLAAHPGCVRAGIAYELQIAGEVPAEPQDVGMQYLVTEMGIKKIGG